MIPFIRSLTELMVITQPRDGMSKYNKNEEAQYIKKNSNSTKLKIETDNKKAIELPKIASQKRRRWIKSKNALSKLLKELDYNNQIQSSYDLTLQESLNNYDHHDVA
tara:strand:+ start:136 stop:456 length:321 start_codon:yes stop_codon:yes gene_type:complete